MTAGSAHWRRSRRGVLSLHKCMASSEDDSAGTIPSSSFEEEEAAAFSHYGALLHDPCMQQVCERDCFLDLDELQFLSTEGIDRHGRRILRVVGKFFPAPVIENVRLKEYIIFKILREVMEEEPLCIVYFHAGVNRADNCPGAFNLRWIYETLPQDFRERLEALYFVHPGLLSKTVVGTFGRLLSNGFYDKVKYVSRLEFLWNEVKKGQVEVPEFVFVHDKVLESRPLMDYWIEPDPFGTLSSSPMSHCRFQGWGS